MDAAAPSRPSGGAGAGVGDAGGVRGVRVLQPFARESLAILFDPSGLGPWFVVGLVGLGLLVPLAVEVFVTVTKRLVRALPVDLLCIAGGLVLRFCVVWSGMH